MLENDFNLPVYINIPLFLYQDKSLDRSALLLSGFFYSLHTSGKKIKVSNQYLSSMLNVSERQVRNALEVLEKNSYIVRQESGTRRKILWCHNPDSEIILVEESNNPELNLRPTRNYPSGLPGTKPPPYNKEDNKEDNKALCASSSKSTITHSTAFEEFWTLYPKKKAKKKCLEIWKRKKLSCELDFIIERLKLQKEKDSEWKDGFAPNPSTYLNGERWNDDITYRQLESEKRVEAKLEAQKRISEQEKATQKQREYENDKINRISQDGKAYRQIVKKVQSDAMKQALGELKEFVGVKNARNAQ